MIKLQYKALTPQTWPTAILWIQRGSCAKISFIFFAALSASSQIFPLEPSLWSTGVVSEALGEHESREPSPSVSELTETP